MHLSQKKKKKMSKETNIFETRSNPIQEYSLQGNPWQERQALCIDEDTCHQGVIICHPAYHLCKYTVAASIRGNFPCKECPI